MLTKEEQAELARLREELAYEKRVMVASLESRIWFLEQREKGAKTS